MSSCCGADDGLADEFEDVRCQPTIIFGSTDERDYNEYAVAWAILYNLFHKEGVHRDVAQKALKAISAVVHPNFRYLRWDNNEKSYLHYPRKGRRYEVTEKRSS